MSRAAALAICFFVASASIAEPLKGRVSADPERPAFVSLNAVSNDEMVGQYKLGQKIPKRGCHMWLHWRVAKLWDKLAFDTYIECKPVDGHPGCFYFQSVDNPKGPRGWIEQKAFYRPGGWWYRHWLDLPAKPQD